MTQAGALCGLPPKQQYLLPACTKLVRTSSSLSELYHSSADVVHNKINKIHHLALYCTVGWSEEFFFDQTEQVN